MLEHEIGGMFDVAHGAGLAAVWGSWARYVYNDCLPRFVRFAVNVMGILLTDSALGAWIQGDIMRLGGAVIVSAFVGSSMYVLLRGMKKQEVPPVE